MNIVEFAVNNLKKDFNQILRFCLVEMMWTLSRIDHPIITILWRNYKSINRCWKIIKKY